MIKIPDNISKYTNKIIEFYLKNSVDPEILICFELYFLQKESPQELQPVVFETIDFLSTIAKSLNKKILLCAESTAILDPKFNEYKDIVDFVSYKSIASMTPVNSNTSEYIFAFMQSPDDFRMSYFMLQQSLFDNGIVQCHFK